MQEYISMYRKNTAGQFICFQLLLTATGAVATGLTPTARRCIDGTFAAGGGTFTEDGSTGCYKYAMSQADTNGNNISIIASATGAIPKEANFITTAADPTDGVRFGLTALPTAAANAAGGLPVSIAGSLDLDEMNTDIEAIQSGQLTAAQTATAVWQDATAGDFTAANSVGKSIMNGVALGTGLTINAYTGNTAQTGDAYAALTGAQAEPGQGTPAANATPLAKLSYLFKWARNKLTNDGVTLKMFASDATTVDQKASVADDGSTFTRGGIATGP